jgi:flagella basal body P-ring formation protein FlgA
VILEYVKTQTDGTGDLQVQVLDPEDPISLPSGTLRMRVLSSLPPQGYGKRNFDVALSVNGKTIQIVKAVGEVQGQLDVVLPTRLIRPDETIQAEDVAMSRVSFVVAPRQVATNLQEVIGKRAVRPLTPRAPIPLAALGHPYVVKKGDRVTIEARRGGLLIQTTGVTKAVGQVGQTIIVTNQDSGKDIRAKVIGTGVVQVEF